jgi:hypothetical protein
MISLGLSSILILWGITRGRRLSWRLFRVYGASMTGNIGKFGSLDGIASTVMWTGLRRPAIRGLEPVHQLHLFVSALCCGYAQVSRKVLRIYPAPANLTTRSRELPSSALPCAPSGSQWSDLLVTPSNPSA